MKVTNTKAASPVIGRKAAEAVEKDPQNERKSIRNGVNDLDLVTGMKETAIDVMVMEIEVGIDAVMKDGDLIWEDPHLLLILALALDPTGHLDLVGLHCRHMTLEIMGLQISRKGDVVVVHHLEDRHQDILTIDVTETAKKGQDDKQKNGITTPKYC